MRRRNLDDFSALCQVLRYQRPYFAIGYDTPDNSGNAITGVNCPEIGLLRAGYCLRDGISQTPE